MLVHAGDGQPLFIESWYMAMEPYNEQFHGTRPVVGQIEYKPCRLAGTRIEPPISVPIPTTLPPVLMRAPSPPELPPEMSWLLNALMDCPNTWL